MMGEFNALRQRVGDVDGLAGLFFEAAETERKMPGVMRKKYRVAWPTYLPDPGLAYGYGEFEVRPSPADAGEVDRWDAAPMTLVWYGQLPIRQ